MQAAITPDEQLAAQTKLALRRLASAVAVVSCRYGDMRHAMTATAVNAMRA
jgi:flavin reductase (DIM6/NTAB) family NADH-FMN oxidoreductase RutF